MHKKERISPLFILFLITISLHFSGFAQFSFRVFPTGVDGDPYADTLLNTRAILMKAGIKQVNAYRTPSETTKTFASKTVNLNKDGRITKLTTCFAPNENSSSTHCIDNTISYDPAGRVADVKTTDNKGNRYPLFIIDYISAKEIKCTSIGLPAEDTTVEYRSYNEQGQLVKLIRTRERREIENTSFYYNRDGLLDSTINTYWGTFLFKRRKNGRGKIIETKTPISSFRWMYNHSGQCIRSSFSIKYRPNTIRESDYKGDLKTEVSYYYNPDGTLSKAITKSSNNSVFTMHYSYSK